MDQDRDLSIQLKNDWSRDEVTRLYELPLLELVYKAATIHRKCHPGGEVQLCTLLSIKTGGCTEDCAYCPQSARYDTGLEAHTLLPVEQVIEAAKEAKNGGSTRFCMGAAWREIKDNKHFDQILEMVREVSALGLEVCCTLGMLNESQARKLKEAGLHAYNHNLDTSPEYYGEIITTRTYDDRLRTLDNVRKAGVTVCCGGIVGMGESRSDRIGLLLNLANLPKHPESVPINTLVKIKGTPLENSQPLPPFEFIRMVAVARLLMPYSKVRLSAGRETMSDELQALAFLAGANSIFSGEKLLTTGNPSLNDDDILLKELGLRSEAAKAEFFQN